MDLAVSLRSLRDRMPWSVAQLVFADEDISPGRGWDQTLEKAGREDTWTEKSDHFERALKEHLLCGEKLVRFHKLDLDQVTELRAIVAEFPVPENQFSDIYPATLERDGLAAAPSGIHLTAVEKHEDGVALVFASSRSIVKREALDRSTLPEAATEALKNYDEVLVTTHKRMQAFDIVWIPHEGDMVDIRIDYPIGMHLEQAQNTYQSVADAFVRTVGSGLLTAPLNLFSMIDSIYFDEEEGTVVELGFGTTTASTKLEKMRRRSLCLRQEHYHKGGKKALEAKIEPYRISLVWNIKIGSKKVSRPELSLNSGLRSSGSENPSLEDAIIRDCMGVADFEHVRSRIIHHISSAESKEAEDPSSDESV